MKCSPLTTTLLLACLICAETAFGDAGAVIEKLMTPPVINASPGFTSRILVAPGRLYDPLMMLPSGNEIWLNDDGGEEKEKGSRLLALTPDGGLRILADIGKLLPTVGFDRAPPNFGAFGGQLFTLSQAKVSYAGAVANHVVQRVDPARDFEASIFCTLPEAGSKKVSGFGLDARFGPVGSPFDGKFFVITIYNDAIYQVSADGRCEPFVIFDGEHYSAPAAIGFTPDGETMLVTVSRGVFDITSQAPPRGAIVRVSANGEIADQALAEVSGKPMAMAYAPNEFGSFGGQLFFADIGRFEIPVPMTQTLSPDGKIYRRTPEGDVKLVASGLNNPIGIQFVNDKLWVTDINGDFIAGKRELPDGFIVEFGVAP